MRRRGWLVSLDCTVCSSSSKQDNKVILSTYKFDIEKEEKEQENKNDKRMVGGKSKLLPRKYYSPIILSIFKHYLESNIPQN